MARTHAVEPAFAAGLIYAPDAEWADKLISQSEVFPKGKHDDMHDSNDDGPAMDASAGLDCAQFRGFG